MSIVKLLTEVEHKEIYMGDMPVYIINEISAKTPWLWGFIQIPNKPEYPTRFIGSLNEPMNLTPPRFRGLLNKPINLDPAKPCASLSADPANPWSQGQILTPYYNNLV
jgi:hypothetical protein